ncbi:MAG: pyridoxal phosphate-dependent decarboxylase family protein [Candidatus Hodarchaeales archaeon]|jgi:L-2,4-diaminobutyrate decarboxylase
MKGKNTDQIYSRASPDQIKTDLLPLVEFQDEGMSLESLNDLIHQNLVPHFANYEHPAFHSLYNFFPEKGAKLGAKIALKYNQGVTNWIVSPGAVMLEELSCKALCHLFNLSPTADATFYYCGTYSNQSALYLALHWTAERHGFDFSKKGLQGFKDPTRLVAITSVDAHFSLKHALRIMGLGDESLVTIPVEFSRKMNTHILKKTIQNLKEEKDIFCVVATAGTTSTGSIDPLSPIADICKKYGIWFHVDAAYGLAYSLIPDRKEFFTGLDRADSITWDPHKQFGVPIPNSLLFVKREKDLYRNAIFSDYFNRADDPEPNPGLKSPPTTRPFSALPVVTTIKYLGLKKVIERLQHHVDVIEKTAKLLGKESDIELFHRPELGILCFRVNPPGFQPDHLDRLQQYIFDEVKAEGKRAISMTKLDNRKVLRIVVLNQNVTPESILQSITKFRTISNKYSV